MRRLLLSLLASLARGVTRCQRPFIVGVTGSVGKTSTKEAIRAVLAPHRSTRSAPKNYNNEIGFPIAIIGGSAPGRSPIAWMGALLRGAALCCLRNVRYPEALVLEYGADHPGDLAVLTRIATPSVGVITAVGPAHTEFFRSVDRVIAEKRRLIVALPGTGVAVLNRDDENVYGMRDRTRAKVITYGFHAEADVRGMEYQVTYEVPPLRVRGGEGELRTDRNPSQPPLTLRGEVPTGIAFKVISQGSSVPVHLNGCIGRGHASSALAAAAVGVSQGMHLVEIAHALERYEPPVSRMRILGGVKRTILIDDTYNSSPLAVVVALETLTEASIAGRRIAVLGDMLELGFLTEHEHQHIGELIAARSFSAKGGRASGADTLVTVGEASRHTAAGARAAGMPADHVFELRTAGEAGRFVQDRLQPGDAVLVKGSQGMRMERIVKELMAEPLRAKELLCRQDDEWLQK